MILIKSYDPEYDDELKEYDKDVSLELLYHKDVIKKTALLAIDTSEEKERQVIGAGYLLAQESFRLSQPSPCYFIHAIQGAKGRHEAEASILLLESLKERFFELAENNPGKHLILRLWCRDSASSYYELLTEMGFGHENTMWIMDKDLEEKNDRLFFPDIFGKLNRHKSRLLDLLRDYSDLSPDAPLPALSCDPVITVKASDFSEDFFKKYIEVNTKAFNAPDSLEDLRFKRRFYDAEIYSAFLGDVLLACVSTWKMAEGIRSTENIFCLPCVQNCGITRMLLGTVLLRLKKDGLKKAVLTVYKDDIPAIRLYSSYGYVHKHTLLEMHLKAPLSVP